MNTRSRAGLAGTPILLLTLALPAQDTAPVPADWLLLGATPGQLDAAPLALPLGNASVSAVLDQLRALRGDLPVDVYYRSVDAAGVPAATGPRMRLPAGRLAEVEPIDALGGGGAPTASEIEYPGEPTIEMELWAEPIHSNFDRHLTFVNHLGTPHRLRVSFRRHSGLLWTATAFPDGIGALQALCEVGARSHWDDLRLENLGGSTALSIKKLRIVMHYDRGSDFENDVTIVDSYLWRTLAAGTSSIDLDAYALSSRKAWAGVTSTMHECVQLAAEDFGKSGSDGVDAYGSNPKFNGADNNLCSEFVSWYYHEAGVVVGGEDFRDIVATATMDQAFHAASRRYDYHNGLQCFVHATTGVSYTPRAGDFLCRRRNGEYEHAMMMLRWDATTKTATVINGPWPVTLRTVRIQDLEVDGGYDFRVGRLP